MDEQQQQPNRASTSNEPLRTDAAITYQRIESTFAAWVKAVPKARRPSLSIPQLCTCRHEHSRALREQIVLPMLLMFSVVGAITVTGSSDSTTNLIMGTDIASGVDPTYTSTTTSIDSFAKGPADASICNLGTTHIARSDGSVTCNAAAEKNLRCPLELLNGNTQPENTADGCGLLGDGDSAVSPNISCVFSPRFESAAATARTCHDYTHLDVDEPQRHSFLRALGPPIGAAAGSLCGGDLIRSSAAAARTSLPEQQPFTTVVLLFNASANDSLIIDNTSSCGSGSAYSDCPDLDVDEPPPPHSFQHAMAIGAAASSVCDVNGGSALVRSSAMSSLRSAYACVGAQQASFSLAPPAHSRSLVRPTPAAPAHTLAPRVRRRRAVPSGTSSSSCLAKPSPSC